MEPYVKIPILFWWALKIEGGSMIYHTLLDGRKEQYYSKRFNYLLEDAKSLCYLVICLN